MALDNIEQERIDLIKAWWQQHKRWVTIVTLAVLVTMVAWFGWKYLQQERNKQASEIYENFDRLTKDAGPNALDIKAAQAIVEHLQKNYSSTAFSWMASLTLAKKSYQKGDQATTEKQLRMVFDSAKPPYRAIAALDLMSLYLEQKKYDQALSLADWRYPDAFMVLFEDRKGDVYLAQKNMTAAREAYTKALGKAENQIKDILNLKLAALSV